MPPGRGNATMLNMERFDIVRATEIAAKAHEGQVDKVGADYIHHPLAVAELVQGEDPKLVAILHDVIEDSDLTLEDLVGMGCPLHIANSVRLVSHSPDYDDTHEGYFRDILRIAESGDQNAIDVKFADLTHNSDRRRIADPTERDFKRWGKYAKAKDILRPLVSEYLKQL